MPIKHIQSNFTRGEIDELLHARIDFDGYYKGAKRLRNVTILPQGGVRRRFGLEYLADLTSFETDYTKVKIIPFELTEGSIFLIVLTDRKLSVYQENTLITTIGSPYSGDQIGDVQYGATNNQLYFVHPEFKVQRLTHRTAPIDWNLDILDFKFLPVFNFENDYLTSTFTPSAKSGDAITITIATGSFRWRDEHVGGIFFGNGGTVRLETKNSDTLMTGKTLTDFITIDTIRGKFVFIGEPCFSETRGYPAKISFVENRLALANTKTLPQGIWLSVLNDFLNYDEYEGTDDGAISFFINSQDSNAIQFILGYKSLLIFTKTAVHSTPPLFELSLSSSNLRFLPQSEIGIGNIFPIILDNQILYVGRGGKIVQNLVYNFQSGTYIQNDISLISQHLIKQPVSAAIYKNSIDDNGNYYLIVNTDGTLPIYQTLTNENVSGWSLVTTEGFFRQVAGVQDQVWFLVERSINSTTKLYIEKLNYDFFTDSGVQQTFGTPTSTITGLDHLEGETVNVKGDGFVFDNATVINGQITLLTPVTQVEVGLPFTPIIVPMPINIQTQTGNNLYLPKHLKSVFIDYYKSLGIIVNGFEIPFLQFSVDRFDAPPTIKSGVYEYTPYSGWDPFVELTITQTQPVPMIIRAIGYEVVIEEES